jgi:uncharacterized membrane protein YeaQ/YmgE (transglycosylase-associated protein family)
MIKRILIGLILGFIGGLIPNNRSNINRLLMGIIFAILGTKVLIGDFDIGYQWTINDIYFVIYTSLLGILGSFLSMKLFKSLYSISL